jgi:hypothetical protein
MSQTQPAQSAPRHRTFEERADRTLYIALGVGFLVIGALGTAHWVSHASSAKASAHKPAATTHAKADSSSVFRCNDGRVSFTPCS